MTTAGPRVDVRTIAPRERHPLICRTFQGLAPGAAMGLVNDHDPRPLYCQFSAVWRAAITRAA